MRTLALLALPALLQAQRVQAPSAPWRTLTTPHYRIHFPAGDGFPAFAQEVASRIEGIHAQYVGLVGHAWAEPIDVLIQDPVMDPNGMAFPFAQRPFVVLWRTPPEAESAIGHHRGWAELLLTHELGHMHHLLIPQRGRSFKDWLLGLKTPVVTKSPRWVAEGYATVIEGRLTGSGRPHSAFRAAVLRTWAREGRLPSYGAVSGGEGFMGGSMAYLVGSAYLTWLEQQHLDRPAILQDFWRQLSGPAHRDFDEAFTATFGHAPDTGYRRFCAEITHGALELERRLKAEGIREGQIVTKLQGWVSDLSVSPDGTKLLARVSDPQNPSLRVWDLKKEPKAPTPPKAGEPADAPPAVPVVAASWTLPRIHGRMPREAAWTADGKAVAFTLRLPNAEGVLHPTAWMWRPGHAPRRLSARAATVAKDLRYEWAEDPEVWNLRRTTDGTWLTRTLSAAWAPAPTPDGKTLYYAQLTATGAEVRKLDLALPPLPHGPLPAEGLPYAPGTVRSVPDEPSVLPAPVQPPPAHDYRVGESLKAFSIMGGHATPSDSGLQIGLGFNDILGRLNGQVLVGEGQGSTLRGALAGATWRGSEWEPGLHLFQARQRLSLQKDAPVSGFDRERQGLAFEVGHETSGLTPFREHLRFTTERQRPLDGGTARSRSVGEVGLGVGTFRSLGEWGFQASLKTQAFAGKTENHHWNGGRGSAAFTLLNPMTPLSVHYEMGRLNGSPTALDRFALGGIVSNLLPEAVAVNQVTQVALPALVQQGDRLRRWRGELELGVGHAYVEHLAVWTATDPRPAYLRVVGWELGSEDLALPEAVVQRLLGRLTFSLGVHRVLDGPTKDHTVGTLTITVRP